MKISPVKIIKKLENNPGSFNKWVVSFGAIITIRLYIEGLILKLSVNDFTYFILFFIHTLLFFGLLFLIFLWILKKITKVPYRKIINILLWGYWFIIFPPIIDRVIFGDRFIWSYYVFDGLSGLIRRFFTFFGDNPALGITYGTRIIIVFVILFLCLYVFLKTRSFLKLFLIAISSYFVFFIFSSFPSWMALGIEFFSGQALKDVNNLDVAKIFLTPFSYFNIKLELELFLIYRLTLFYNFLCLLAFFVFLAVNYQKKFIALIKNIRFPQAVFNFGLLFMGMGVGFYYFPKNEFDFFSVLIVLNLLIMVFSSWFFSVFINDLTDQKVDKESNPQRPLIKNIFKPQEYSNFSKVFLFFSSLTSLLIGFQVFTLIAAYHLLTWVYSHYPFRLKRFYPISSILSAFASLIFFIIGFLIFSENQSLVGFPWKIFFFLMAAFSLMLPIKDFKDIRSDKKDGVYTLPVILGAKNAKNFLAVALFFLYLFSVVLLKEPKLFLPALIFASISFWFLIKMKIKDKKIIWWLLFLIFLYGLAITKTVFT